MAAVADGGARESKQPGLNVSPHRVPLSLSLYSTRVERNGRSCPTTIVWKSTEEPEGSLRVSLNISPFLPPTHTPPKTTNSKKRSKR